ncbi:MAG: hypothetical protein K6B28_00570 [Lachnospiraceae bacterium]|nr:hypothetical protein [Lachnospiraceae bacterium]
MEINNPVQKKGLWPVNIYEWYYILVILGYVATLFTDKMRPGVFAAALMLIILARMTYKKQFSVKSTTDILILVYFFYNIISVFWLKASGLPVTVHLNEFVVSVLPMIFYFVGKSCDTDEKKDSFYSKFVAALLIVGFLGIFFHIFAPQFYIDYSFRYSFISKADAQTSRVRMDSVVGCTVLGALGVSGMLAGAHFIDRKDTRLKGIFFILCNFIFAVLSNQRSAMVASLIVIVYINYLIFWQFDIVDRKYFRYEMVMIIAALTALWFIDNSLVMKIWWRLESLPLAVSERSEQWIAAINNMYSTWFGNGLGANGHKALGLEDTHVIADGGLIKLYCEEGIIGLSLYIYILIISLKKGIGAIKRYYVEVGIIVIALLQSIGSNILAFQPVAPIFWFALGVINEEDK